MKNIHAVQLIEAFDNWNEYAPNLFLVKSLFLLSVICDFLVKITVISELHDDAQVLLAVGKGFFILDDVSVINWSQDAYFI